MSSDEEDTATDAIIEWNEEFDDLVQTIELDELMELEGEEVEHNIQWEGSRLGVGLIIKHKPFSSRFYRNYGYMYY
jgi:hypothetical protein